MTQNVAEFVKKMAEDPILRAEFAKRREATGDSVDVGKIANGCFLTTACCEAKGLPDNCPELQAFRQLRDDYVLHRPDGAALVESYYQMAPRIVTAIKSSADADQVLAQMYANLVVPNVRTFSKVSSRPPI